MSRNLNAEASAPKSGISTFGATAPTTSPTDDSSRTTEVSGNTYTQKNPLTNEEKDQLILDAIQKRMQYPIMTWGAIDLYYLFAHEHEDYNYVGTEECRDFFQELLLFVAKPGIAQEFSNEVKEGLKRIKKLTKFFTDLDGNDHQREFIDYMLIDGGVDEKLYERIAKRYLSGAELQQVLDEPATDEQKPQQSRIYDLLRSEYTGSNLSATPLYPELFQTEQDWIAALDRYFPGIQWPAEKKIIILDPYIQQELKVRERERLERENETPDQKQARLLQIQIKNAVFDKVGEDMRKADAAANMAWARGEAATMKQAAANKATLQKKPAGAVSGKGGAVKRKSTTPPAKKPTTKPTTTKKKA